MFRSCTAAVLTATLGIAAVTGLAQAQNPTNGDDLIFRSVDVGGSDVSFVIHRYTTVNIASTFSPPDGVSEVEYLIVAGGGAGGWRGGDYNGAGGGGAGGLLTNVGAPHTLTGGSPYPVVVGAGGSPVSEDNGENGAPSSVFGFEAIGGGGGARFNNDGNDGGSGGGAAGRRYATSGNDGGEGEPGQGHKGGDRTALGTGDSSDYGGAGGGGAGAAGADNIASQDGQPGGAGLLNTITGEDIYYAGGGGGGRASGGQPGTGGAGGGGAGHSAGTDGLGGGGGGGSFHGSPSPGKGGSGVVVVRYRLDDVTGWNANGYYALPDQGIARTVLVDDSIDVQVSAGHEFSILPGGTFSVGNGASLAVQGTLTMQGMLDIDAGGQAAIEMGGLLMLDRSGGPAVAGNLLISGGTVTFSRNNQLDETADVTMSAGRFTQRNNHQETLGSLTATGGEFRTGEDSRWTINGDAVFTGGAENTLIVVNSGTEITLNSLTLTDLTSTEFASDNSFTFYGNRSDVTTILLGGDLTLDNSRILMRTTTAGSAGGAVVLGGNVTATGTSAIQKAGDLDGCLWLNTTDDPVTRTFDVGDGGSLEIEAVVTNGQTSDDDPAGPGSIVKSGPGRLTFSKTNTYTGETVVNQGTLMLDSPGTAVPGDLVLSGGNVTFNQDEQIVQTANVTITAGHLNTTDGLDGERRSDHTETFASLTATGGTFVTGFDSLWTIGNGHFTGGTGDTQVRVNSGAHVVFDSLTLTDMTSSTYATDKSFTLYGSRLTTVTVGDGGLTLDNSRIILQWTSGGGGALILGGDVTASGTSTIQKHSTAAAGNRFVWLNTTADAVTRTFDVAGYPSHLRIDVNITDGDGAAGAAGILKTGAGTLTLQGSNTYTGGTTVAEGVLTIQATGALPGWNTAGAFSVAGGAVLAVRNDVSENDFHTMRTLTGNFQSGAAIGIDTRAGDRTFTTSITGGLPLAKVGSGTLTLTGENDYTGDTLVLEGTLMLDRSGGPAVPGNVVIRGGNVTFNQDEQIVDTATVSMTAGNLNSTSAGPEGRRSNHTETFAGLNVTSGAFLTGPGSSWTITGDGSFSREDGNTMVVINSGSELSFGGLALSDLTSGTVSSANSFSLYGDNASAITPLRLGSGGLSLNTSRILMHMNSSSNAGAALVLGGDVTATGTSTIERNGLLETGNRFVWLNTTAGPVARTFEIAAGGSLWTDAVVTDGQTGGGNPAGAASLVKTGPGTLALAAANTYTGTTTVTAGTLEVTGSLINNTSADVLVASAGTAFDGTEPNIVRRVANNASLAGFGSQIVGEPRLAGFHTEAQLLAGENETGGPLEVGMAWRMFGEGEAQSTASYLRPVSDVLQLSGMADAEEPTDPFVLQMTYDESLVTPATEGGLHLAWLDGTQWVNAVTGNIGTGTDAVARYWGPWDSFASEYGNDLDALLGSWGVDTDGAAVWAVLNHNSQFGVLVPEPGSLVLLALAVLGLLLGRQRRFRF